MHDLAFVLFVQLQAAPEVILSRLPFHMRSVSWEKRYVKMADVVTAEVINEVRERLAALLQID